MPVSFSGGCSCSNRVPSSMEEFAPKGANFSVEEVTLLKREEKKGEVVELFHLKIYPFTLVVLIRNILASVDFSLVPLS